MLRERNRGRLQRTDGEEPELQSVKGDDLKDDKEIHHKETD